MAAQKAASPAYSAGARYERKAFRAHLTRAAKKGSPLALTMLEWVRQRQARYDKKTGGL